MEDFEIVDMHIHLCRTEEEGSTPATIDSIGALNSCSHET